MEFLFSLSYWERGRPCGGKNASAFFLLACLRKIGDALILVSDLYESSPAAVRRQVFCCRARSAVLVARLTRGVTFRHRPLLSHCIFIVLPLLSIVPAVFGFHEQGQCVELYFGEAAHCRSIVFFSSALPSLAARKSGVAHRLRRPAAHESLFFATRAAASFETPRASARGSSG